MCSHHPTTWQSKSDNAEWMLAETQRRKWVQRGARTTGRYIADIRKRVLMAIEESFSPEGAATAGTAAASDIKRVEKMIADIWIPTGLAYGNRIRRELAKRKSDWWEVTDWWETYVYDLIATDFAKKITGIDATTQAAIRKVLQDGVEQGMSVQDMAEMIAGGKIPNMDAARAIRIARTEVIGASNGGSIQGARSMGIEGLKKKWLVALDGRERPTHRNVSAQTMITPIDINDKFNVGGSLMDYPGDPMGEASEVVNCRCAIGYVTPTFG